MPLRLVVAFHNVDSVTYVTTQENMLPFYILYSRKAAVFSLTRSILVFLGLFYINLIQHLYFGKI